ncbi:hypothetical protein FD754_006752, partial [Muntiacus muntjak]
HRNGTKKSQSGFPLHGWTVSSQRTCFTEKHNKKGLKKAQANNTKAMNACVEAVKALVKPKEVKSKIPKGGSCKLSQLAYTAHPKHRKHTHPKSQAKTESKAKVTTAGAAATGGQAQALKGAMHPQSLQSTGLHLPM